MGSDIAISVGNCNYRLRGLADFLNFLDFEIDWQNYMGMVYCLSACNYVNCKLAFNKTYSSSRCSGKRLIKEVK